MPQDTGMQTNTPPGPLWSQREPPQPPHTGGSQPFSGEARLRPLGSLLRRPRWGPGLRDAPQTSAQSRRPHTTIVRTGSWDVCGVDASKRNSHMCELGNVKYVSVLHFKCHL